MPATAKDVLDFWFQQLTPAQWFAKNETLDQLITEKFLTLHQQAAQGELWSWRETPRGRLAEIIVLDQFSRNMYRNSALAFSTDSTSLVLAQEALSQQADHSLNDAEKAFLYMPFMHSESALMQEKSLALFSQPGLEGNYPFAVQHKAIIDQFGRYPHRNEVLQRPSTPAEQEFLSQPHSSF